MAKQQAQQNNKLIKEIQIAFIDEINEREKNKKEQDVKVLFKVTNLLDELIKQNFKNNNVVINNCDLATIAIISSKEFLILKKYPKIKIKYNLEESTIKIDNISSIIDEMTARQVRYNSVMYGWNIEPSREQLEKEKEEREAENEERQEMYSKYLTLA